MFEFEFDQPYTRRFVSQQVGGKETDYLPNVHGRTTAICLRPEFNPFAPNVVFAGPTDDNIRSADLLMTGEEFIPLFLRVVSGDWRFQGLFRAQLRFTQDDQIDRFVPPGFVTDRVQRPSSIIILQREDLVAERDHLIRLIP